MVARYLAWQHVNNSPKTVGLVKRALKTFFHTTKVTSLNQFTPALMERYKETRLAQVSRRTVNIEVTTVKAMLNRLEKLGVINRSPIRHVSRIRGSDQGPVEFLSLSEISALLEASRNTVYYPIIFTYLKTGIRREELIYLEWSDIDFDRVILKITSKKHHPTKTRTHREIPFGDDLRKVFEELAPPGKRRGYIFKTKDGDLRLNNILTNLKRLAKKAGIEKNVTIHLLRHTCCSHLIMAGIDLPTVRKWMGHSDIKTTLRYAHLSPEHLRQAAARLPY